MTRKTVLCQEITYFAGERIEKSVPFDTEEDGVRALQGVMFTWYDMARRENLDIKHFETKRNWHYAKITVDFGGHEYTVEKTIKPARVIKLT